jgi:ATP-dependent RNA helicase DDX47/RRP3
MSSSEEDNRQSDVEEEVESEEEDQLEGIEAWSTLGIKSELAQMCVDLKWSKPTKIQKLSIPVAIEGKDVIGLAETGSGKTAAFALPVLQTLLNEPGESRLSVLVLTPTRELAFQIKEQFQALGSSIGLSCVCITGGMEMMSQQLALAKKPHVVIATPGRLVDHLEKTKGFNMKMLKFLIMDEADRILNMDFEQEVDKILRAIPRERKTYLFSATMTAKVKKLQRAALKNPVKIAVNSKYKTVDKNDQKYLFIPESQKETYLVSVVNELTGNSFMIFASTCNKASLLSRLLRRLGFDAVPLHGQMSQQKRLGALSRFKAKSRSVLVCTDVAARGLDTPHVDCVINYDVPTNSKDYIHRVGRTARAGRAGKSITFVSQYDVEIYQRIESAIGKKLEEWSHEKDQVMALKERVEEAKRIALQEIKEEELKRKNKRKFASEDNESAVKNKIGKIQHKKKEME